MKISLQIAVSQIALMAISLAAMLPRECFAEESNTRQLASIGTAVEAFTLTDYLGKEWSQAEFQGKKAVVYAFVGTQCPLAKLYSAKLVELAKKFQTQDVLIVAVDSNVQDSLAEMAAHARKFRFEFPFLKDPAQNLANRLGVTRTPEVCVVDQDNKIRYRGRIDDQYGIGYTREKPTKTELIDAIDSILKGDEIQTTTSTASGCLIGRGPRDVEILASEPEVTYADQVSRILQSRCVSCHRPGEIGPMDLSNYEDASAWADMIAEVVSDKRMPPWHASPEYGSFENDRRLPEDEIATLQRWVALGAVRGDATHEPPQLKFVDGWQMSREPDLVVPMANKPAEIPARGDVKYQYFVADPKLTEETWVNGMEIVAGNPSVVHHILVFIREKNSNKRDLDGARGFLVGYVPGTRVQMMPEGMGKRIPANSEFVFQVHYTPNGTATTDLSKVGFWIADPQSITHEIHTTSSVQPELRIPPREANYQTSAMQPEELPECDLLSMSPHMHVRGKSFRYTAVYADGKREILMDVPNYDFNWQTEYRLKEKKRLPKGTRIFCEAAFDNSTNNLNNPDPNAWVHWGDQTYEEMMIGYFHVSIPVDPSLGRSPEIKKAKPPGRPSVLEVFEILDTDKDGKLLKNEVPKKLLPTFEKLDKNADGILEKSELPK